MDGRATVLELYQEESLWLTGQEGGRKKEANGRPKIWVDIFLTSWHKTVGFQVTDISYSKLIRGQKGIITQIRYVRIGISTDLLR